MSNLVVSGNGVHLAGSFGSAGYPEWSPGGISLSDANGDGVYSVTLNLHQGQSYQYKFINGNSWGQDESVPGGCESGGNRSVSVANSDINIPFVCFGSCSNCVTTVNNDSPYTAPTVYYSSNAVYPNCYPINGSTVSASNSVQSSTYSGSDVWYRFTAQSSAVSITLSSSTDDDAIELYSKTGNTFNLMSGGSENASAGAADFERLNYSGLTPGTVYYISVGSVSSTVGASFTLCIQHLMPSGCSYSIPAGGFGLCSAYKAIYRGTPAQGVTYDFSFNGVGGGASGTTSVSGTNGLITLSNPSLALRYGGIYDVTVNVNYALQNSAGTTENIIVNGNSASANCSSVNISTQPMIEVKDTQRCPSTLLRSNYLIGKPVTGASNACGAINYTYEFTQLDACSGSTQGLPVEYTTVSSTPYLALGNLPALGNTGSWRVRIRPNFTYGNGVYGPAQDVSVSNTAASTMLPGDDSSDEKVLIDQTQFGIYPNPNNGDMLNVNITGITSPDVYINVLNQVGQIVFSDRYVVDGSLNTILNFSETLATGVYLVEMNVDGHKLVQRMVVQK